MKEMLRRRQEMGLGGDPDRAAAALLVTVAGGVPAVPAALGLPAGQRGCGQPAPSVPMVAKKSKMAQRLQEEVIRSRPAVQVEEDMGGAMRGSLESLRRMPGGVIRRCDPGVAARSEEIARWKHNSARRIQALARGVQCRAWRPLVVMGRRRAARRVHDATDIQRVWRGRLGRRTALEEVAPPQPAMMK